MNLWALVFWMKPLFNFPDLNDDSDVFSVQNVSGPPWSWWKNFRTLKRCCSFILKLSDSRSPLEDKQKIWSFRKRESASCLAVSSRFLKCWMIEDFWLYYFLKTASLIMLGDTTLHTELWERCRPSQRTEMIRSFREFESFIFLFFFPRLLDDEHRFLTLFPFRKLTTLPQWTQTDGEMIRSFLESSWSLQLLFRSCLECFMDALRCLFNPY